MPEIEKRLPTLADAIPQQGIADAAGGSTYTGLTESEAAGDVAFGGPTADFILYGVVNGAFAQGPPDSTQNIEPVNNPLPYWSGPTQVSGGAITASWATVATYPSGQALRLTMPAGAAGDEAYFEQIVPIGGSARQHYSHVCRLDAFCTAFTGAGSGLSTVELQYLTVSGATTGAASAGTGGFSSVAAVTINRTGIQPVPADAAFLRVRIGIRRNTMAATGTATVEFPTARLERGVAYVQIPDIGDAATYTPGRIYQGSGTLNIGANFDTGNEPFIALNDTLQRIDLNGGALISRAVIYSNIITPTIAGTVDNWAPTAIEQCVYIIPACGGVSRVITGISATSFVEGQTFWIQAAAVGGGGTLTLNHDAAASTAGNRFWCPSLVNYAIRRGAWVPILYTTNGGGGANSPFNVLGA